MSPITSVDFSHVLTALAVGAAGLLVLSSDIGMVRDLKSRPEAAR